MAKNNENVNQENQVAPEEIKEEEMTLAMVQIPWWKKALHAGKYVLATAVGFIGKAIFDKIRNGGNDDDSGNDASESDE